MPRGISNQDHAMLNMALVGYEFEKTRIEQAIQNIREQLGGARRGPMPVKSIARKTASAPANAPSKTTGKRVLSEAARRRIIAGQKRRWAAHRKQLAEGKK
jgi:hypothetical protein